MTGAPAAPRRLVSAANRSLITGGAAFLLLFAVVHAVLAATTTGITPAGLGELVLICGPLVVFSLRRSMSGPVAAVSVAALLCAAALACTDLPVDGRPLGYAAWQFGAIAFVLFGFSLTGRYATAALAMAGVVAIAVAWSELTGQGPWPGVGLVVRHVATLLVGTCFAVALRRAAAASRGFHVLTRRRRTEELATEAKAVARRAAAEVVLEQAGPMLAAIAEGRPLSDGDRRELRVVEGALRDRIRAPAMQVGRLPASVAAARRRGVDVLVLDEATGARGPGPGADGRERAAEWLAGRLDRVAGGGFVAHLRLEPGALRVTAVAGDVSEAAEFAD